jgi:hypothetical protein
VLYLLIIIWSISILFFEIIGYYSYLMVANVIIATVFSALIAYNGLVNSHASNWFRGLTGLLEIILGFVIIFIDFNLTSIGILWLLGAELIGLSFASVLKGRSSETGAASTKRPDTFDPEPSPEPNPF